MLKNTPTIEPNIDYWTFYTYFPRFPYSKRYLWSDTSSLSRLMLQSWNNLNILHTDYVLMVWISMHFFNHFLTVFALIWSIQSVQSLNIFDSYIQLLSLFTYLHREIYCIQETKGNLNFNQFIDWAVTWRTTIRNSENTKTLKYTQKLFNINTDREPDLSQGYKRGLWYKSSYCRKN